MQNTLKRQINAKEYRHMVLFETKKCHGKMQQYNLLPIRFCRVEKFISMGDVNLDGSVNIKDATAIQKHIANLITLDEKGYDVADVDGSGSVNIKDATAIQKHIAGIETGYPIGETVK